MIVINNIDDQRFSLNGIKHYKNFLSKVDQNGNGDNLLIYNAYFSIDTLGIWTKYDEFIVDGNTYNNAAFVQEALLPVLYTRNSLSDSGSLPSTTPAVEIIYLGAGAYQNTAGNSTTDSEFAAHVNSVGFSITEGKIAIFNITVKRQISGQVVMAKEQYYFKNNNTAGTWGTSSTNGVVAFSDFVFDSQKIVTQVSADTIFISLGNIGNDKIYEHINALDPGTITWENLLDGKDYLFSCIRSGINETYRYEGTLPRTIGTGTTPLEVGDFDLIDNGSSLGSSPIPGIEQVLLADKNATTRPELKGGLNVGADDGSPALIRLKGGLNGSANLELYMTQAGALVITQFPIQFQAPQLLIGVDAIVSYSDIDWNVGTNNLNLSNGDNRPIGFSARVSSGGTFDFGAGAITFNTGDLVGRNRANEYFQKYNNNQGSGVNILPLNNTFTGSNTFNEGITVKKSSLFGANLSQSTALPLNVSFGGTYGTNSPGNKANLKWDLFNSGAGNRYGIGMSAGLMEFQAGLNAGHAFFVSQGARAMTILKTGELGIGVAVPTEKLEVNGKIKATSINFSGLPTASAGLSTGDVWNDSGTLKIV